MTEAVPEIVALPSPENLTKFIKNYKSLKYTVDELVKDSNVEIDFKDQQYLFFGHVSKSNEDRKIRNGPGVLIQNNSWF